MSKNKKSPKSLLIVPEVPEIPDFGKAFKGVLRSEEELQYGLRGVVRILSNCGKNGKNGYFFEGFKVQFASELKEIILNEEVFLDYENLKTYDSSKYTDDSNKKTNYLKSNKGCTIKNNIFYNNIITSG